MYFCRTMNAVWLLLTLSFSAVAQQAASKTLLWRISGHGLQKPSYLYGTMHLTDKRLFKFGDSVYHAIEQADGLAIEVNPDELAAYYINRLFDQMENGKKLSDLLRDRDFRKYSDALARKFKKPASEVTTSDIVKEKNKWMSDYMEKGEMPTFVDAYLYNLARRQGKWVGGIEDIADQAGLMEDMVDKSDIENLLMGDSATNSKEINSGLEHMIALYTNGDLEGIEAFSNGGTTQEKKDRMLINRNIKMARRIDSLVNLRTMFLAVGAAHLPGDTGVIDLLRKRGFTVSPVMSSRKIEQEAYTFKEVKIPWYPVDDSQGLYSTSMPGNPASVKLFGLVEMKFLMDIFNMSGYCTMAVASAIDFTKNDSAYDNLAKRMFQTDKIQPGKIVHNNGIEGREYVHIKKGANLRLQVFLYNKAAYISFMYALKQAAMYTDDANKFFDAMVINKNRVQASGAQVFTDSVMGISFVSPVALEYNKKLSNDEDAGWKINTFSGTDLAAGSYILVYSKQVKPGHYISSDSIIFKDFYDVMGKQCTILQTTDGLLDGVRTLKVSGRNIAEPSLYMNAFNLIKNGRNLLIVTITDSAHLHAASIDRIFESVRFIPHPAVVSKPYTSPDNRVSCVCPAPVQGYTSADNKYQFYSYDTAASVTYSIIPDTLSKYYWANDDSTYWKQRVAYNLGIDSLIQQQPVQNGALHGVELLAKERKNLTRYKRIRLLRDGDKLYKLFASAEKEFLYNDATNHFFGSFTVHATPGDPLAYLTPKTALLLRDLAGRDSAARHDAYNALEEAAFTGKDRVALQDAVFGTYFSLYDTTLSNTINHEIAGRLASIGGDSTISFVQTRYNTFTERKDTLKNIALAVLAKMHTKKGYEVIAQLLQQSPPRQYLNYQVTNALKDSLALTAAIYPALQKLAGDTVHATSIADIATVLIDSGFIKREQVQEAEPHFIHSAEQLLPALVRDMPTDYDIYRMVSLLGSFKSAASNKTLQKYLAVKSPWLKKKIVLALTENNQPVPVAVVNVLAADKAIRYELYNDLKDLQKKAVFPARYATQAYFAESAAYNAATGDDEDLSSMVFLSKKTARYKNKQYTFYLYKVHYENDDSGSYLAIAGGYATGSTGLEPAADISGVYRQKVLDAKNAGSLLADYIRDLEKYYEEHPDEGK